MIRTTGVRLHSALLLTLLVAFAALLSACGGGGGGSGGGGNSPPPAATLQRIEITPASPSLAKGTTRQLTATAVYSDGTSQNVTSSANWSSSAPTIASVGNSGSGKGLLTGVNVGSATLTANFQGVDGTTTATVTAATPVSLELTPTNPSLPDGATQQLTATATFTDGSTQNVSASSAWSSASPTVATVNNAGSKGLVTAVDPGTAVITAQFMSLTATTTVTVTAAVPTSLEVTPTNPSVPKGTTQQFGATLIYSDSSTQDVTSTATWTSSDATVAPVSNSSGTKGLAAASTEGSATISATAMGQTGSTTMTVSSAAITSIDVTPKNSTVPAGYERQFTATATLSDGSTSDVTQDVLWTSNNTGIATISNADGSKGRATGVAAGTTSIVARSGAVQGSTVFNVSSATLSSIGVTPANPSIAKGRTQQFTATGTFSDATTEDLTTQVTWASTAATVATISNADGSRGLAQSVDVGSTTISAARGGTAISGSTTLTVTAAVLVSIEVAPDPATVAKGLTVQFSATGRYSDNSTATISNSVTWSSSDTAIATISNATGSKGLATGVAVGAATITATDSVSTVSDTASLTVTAAVLQAISVTPANRSVPRGSQVQYTATGTFSDASTQDLTTSVTWASSDTSKATISNAAGTKGLASTLATGATTISATMTGVTGSTPLTITQVALVSITITPDNASLPVGLTLQLTATGNYSDGTTLDFTTTVTWGSSDPAVADVSNADPDQGRVNGASTGSVTITATDPKSGFSDQTTVTVTAAVLTSIAVTPANTTLPAGFSRQYQAIGTYSDASTQDLTTQVTWTSFDPATASIGNATGSKGLATGVAAGTTTLRAAMGAVTGQTGITVTTATLTSIAVTPATATIRSGGTQQYEADGTFSDGATLRITTQVTWSSSNTNVATISNTEGSKGLATGSLLPAGMTTTIGATRGAVTGTATLTGSL